LLRLLWTAHSTLKILTNKLLVQEPFLIHTLDMPYFEHRMYQAKQILCKSYFSSTLIDSSVFLTWDIWSKL
jgi:hypothetical protein